MEPKTFTAPTTQEALELVQNELGPEAVILSVRQVPSGQAWEVWKQPYVEVLAIPASPKPISSKAPTKRADPSTQQAQKSALHLALNNLLSQKQTQNSPAEIDPRTYLAQLAEKLARQQVEQTPPPSPAPAPAKQKAEVSIPPALIQARQALTEQGLDSEMIRDLLRRASESLNPKVFYDESRLRQALGKQLETYLRILRIERWQAGKARTARVLFVIGQSGAGKTSFCAKLTAHLQQSEGRHVAWVCADTIRTGAIAQTRAYAEVLGIEPHFAYTASDLHQILSELEKADLILVDTPARNPYNSQEIIELGELLTVAPQKVTFLVLPASAKEADLQQAVAAFSPLGINAFVFSKLDETRQYGSLFNIVWKSKIPIAYLCDGNQILDHLHPAEASYLSNLILSKSS